MGRPEVKPPMWDRIQEIIDDNPELDYSNPGDVVRDQLRAWILRMEEREERLRALEAHDEGDE